MENVEIDAIYDDIFQTSLWIFFGSFKSPAFFTIDVMNCYALIFCVSAVESEFCWIPLTAAEADPGLSLLVFLIPDLQLPPMFSCSGSFYYFKIMDSKRFKKCFQSDGQQPSLLQNHFCLRLINTWMLQTVNYQSPSQLLVINYSFYLVCSIQPPYTELFHLI